MKKYLVAVGLVTACAACCAPLLLAAGSGLGVALLPFAFLWLWRRQTPRRKAACECSSTCDANSRCGTPS